MRKSSILACLLLTAFTAGTRTAVGQHTAPPNIVFILADDLGWGELGCYGNTFNETPFLDSLASQGLRFTEAYAAAPVCSPTRASILTGEYPARVGITDFLAPKSKEYLNPDSVKTLNELLSAGGYHTGIIGKWHLDTHFRDEKGSPARFHFDEVIASETKYIADGDYFFPYDKIATLAKGTPGEYLTDRQSAEAVDYIRRNSARPFFLYLSYYAVHTRLDAPDSVVQRFSKKFDQRYGAGQAARYFSGKRHQSPHLDNPWLAAMLSRIDAGVGAVMRALDSAGVARNTIVVFFSDNGGAHGVANNGGLRAGKSWLYEGGIREPLVIRWPGRVRPGTVTDVPVSSVDFLPTLLDIAGLPPSPQPADGVDLRPLLEKGRAPRTRPLYWYYPSVTAGWKNRMAAAVRLGDLKLIHFFTGGRDELYDLRTDPAEKVNLAGEKPRTVRDLTRRLTAWETSVNAHRNDPPAQ
jgi:arylsulfatase A-like enzyme